MLKSGQTPLCWPQFVHVVALLVDAQRALELREGLTHREVTLASGEAEETCPVFFPSMQSYLHQPCMSIQ